MQEADKEWLMIRLDLSGWMFLLVLVVPEKGPWKVCVSVCVCVCVCVRVCMCMRACVCMCEQWETVVKKVTCRTEVDQLRWSTVCLSVCCFLFYIQCQLDFNVTNISINQSIKVICNARNVVHKLESEARVNCIIVDVCWWCDDDGMKVMSLVVVMCLIQLLKDATSNEVKRCGMLPATDKCLLVRCLSCLHHSI